MTPDDATRAELFDLLEPTLGRDATTGLMAHLPPAGWPEFATRSDLELVGARIGGRIDRLEERLSGESSRLDVRIGGLNQRLDEKITALDRTLSAKIAESEQRVIAAIRGELVKAVNAQTRYVVISVIGSAAAILGVVRYD